MAHAHAERRGDRSRARRLEAAIDRAWRDLRRWQRREDLDDTLHDLRKQVR